MSSLTRIALWGQQLVCEVLQPGELAVDLTSGKGRDTYALVKAVDPEGQVVALDLQAAALEQTTELLQSNDFTINRWPADLAIPKQAGIFLVQACHSTLDKLLQHPAKAIIANLGYMPGGDPSLVTRPDSTLAVLQQSLELLSPGGRLAVTVYPAHPGGGEERTVVNEFFCSLPSDLWKVLSLRAVNCIGAPCLLVAERTSRI